MLFMCLQSEHSCQSSSREGDVSLDPAPAPPMYLWTLLLQA